MVSMTSVCSIRGRFSMQKLYMEKSMRNFSDMRLKSERPMSVAMTFT